MINQSYFPKNEANRVIWLSNFNTKLLIHGTELTIDPAEQALTITDIGYYIWMLQTWYPSIQQSAFEATALKNNIGNGPSKPICTLPVHSAITPPGQMPIPGVLTRLFNYNWKWLDKYFLATPYIENRQQEFKTRAEKPFVKSKFW